MWVNKTEKFAQFKAPKQGPKDSYIFELSYVVGGETTSKKIVRSEVSYPKNIFFKIVKLYNVNFNVFKTIKFFVNKNTNLTFCLHLMWLFNNC